MGPFVPDIFSGELNYIIALLIGIAFGFILENAGFSASRKLAGLFYGYDFTVLKVFFTAAIVATVGLIFFNYFGLINLDVIFINPTFLQSAIVGGIIMGAGFIVGGFCPGTSICASVIGKIDAMFFVGGLLIGIFLFTVTYPFIESFYKAGALGSIFVYDSLSITKGWFVFWLILAASGAFIFATILEKKINNATEHPEKPFFKKYIVTLAVTFVVAVIIIFTPNWKTKIINNADKYSETKKKDIVYLTPQELAFKLIHEDNEIELVDLRTPKEFKISNIPTSINIPLAQITEKEWYDYIRKNHKILVFYGNNSLDAEKAYFVAKEFGHDYNAVLTNGYGHFESTIMNPVLSDKEKDISLFDKWDKRFRLKAKYALEEIKKKKANAAKPKKKKVVRVVGGC